MNNYPSEQNDTVSVGKPWGKGRLTHDFLGPLASRNPNTGNNSKPIGFQNRFDAFDKRKNNRGLKHENNFQEVNQQNSSTRFFSPTDRQLRDGVTFDMITLRGCVALERTQSAL
jgi:hypothetical protein